MARLSCLAATVLALIGTAGPLRATQRATGDVEGLDRLAGELEALEHGTGPETVAQRIHALGSASAPAVFEALSREELPLPEGTLSLGEREHGVLLDGARRIGREAFVVSWTEAASSADDRRRRTVIELVGLVGRSGDLGILVQAAAPPETGGRPAPGALSALAEATTELLERDHGTLAPLRPAILHAPAELAGSMVRAAGNVPSERTLAFLVDLLGFETPLELPLLSQIARVARGQAPPFDEDVRARVRPYLEDPDRQVARAAAMALGELQDEDAVPALLEAATSPDAALSGAAFAALERTTGLSLPRRLDRWHSWLAAEQEWRAERSSRILAKLEGASVSSILSALSEISAHRLGRQQMSPLVARLLAHPEARVRIAACRTLQALGSSAPRASLEEALSDPVPEVVAAASDALRVLQDRRVPGKDPAGVRP